jgi:hypothetical protein
MSALSFSSAEKSHDNTAEPEFVNVEPRNRLQGIDSVSLCAGQACTQIGLSYRSAGWEPIAGLLKSITNTSSGFWTAI